MIGRRLGPALASAGHHVVASIRKRSGPPPAFASRVVLGDLTDRDVCMEAMNMLRTEPPSRRAIVHLAGVGSVALAKFDSDAVFTGNVEVTKRVLEAAQVYEVARVVFASTGLVYGTKYLEPVSETMMPNPESIYAATKLAAEALIQGYASDWNMSGELVRLGNVYGPDSPETTVVGRILGQIRSGKPASVWSRAPVRDFIFIDDVVEAFCRLLTITDEPGCQITNVSSGVGTSIGALADTAEGLAGRLANRQTSEESQDRLILSNEKLLARTGWRPGRSVADGLASCLSGFVRVGGLH